MRLLKKHFLQKDVHRLIHDTDEETKNSYLAGCSPVVIMSS